MIPKSTFYFFLLLWVIGSGNVVNHTANTKGSVKLSLLEIIGMPHRERKFHALRITNPDQFIEFNPYIVLKEGINPLTSFSV